MSLRKKFIGIIGIIFAFFVLSMGLLNYFYLRTQIYDSAFSDMSFSAQLLGSSITAHFESWKKRTVDWSVDYHLRVRLEKITDFQFQESDNESEQKESVEDLIKEVDDYVDTHFLFADPSVMLVDVLDLNGIVIASTKKGRVGENEGEEKSVHFSKAQKLRLGEIEVVNFIIEEDELEGQMMAHFITPVFSLNNAKKPIGYILAHVLAGEFIEIISKESLLRLIPQKEKPDFYRPIDFYLVDDKKLVVTPPSFAPAAVFKIKADIVPVNSCLETEKEYVGVYRNFQNMKVMGASICFNDYGFVLVGEKPEKEILKTIAAVEKNLVISSFVVGIGGFGILLYFFSVLSANFNKILAGVKALGGGDFKKRVRIKSGDELERLAADLNKAGEQLEKYYSALNETTEKLEAAKRNLEDRVKERTEELELIKHNLEKEVKEKTKDITEKLEQLEKFEALAVGREMSMIKLKERIGELEEGLKQQNH